MFIEEIEHGFYVIRVDEIVDEQEKTFEEAYNDVISDVKDEEISKKTKVVLPLEYYVKGVIMILRIITGM